MDRAVSCSATMIGVRYTARELWDFVKATNSYIEDGVLKPGVPGVQESTAFLTEFCGLLLDAKPDLENAPLPLYFTVPVAGKGSLDVVFTKRSAFLRRVLIPQCVVSEDDIPPDMWIPEEPPGTAAPGGDRDTEADVEMFNRRADFVEQLHQGEECCPDPGQAADVPGLSCDELDIIVEAIKSFAVDDDEETLETVEALLRNRVHEQFQRAEIVEALNGTPLTVESKRRIAEALQEGEALSDDAQLTRRQLEEQGSLDRPAAEDEAAAEAAAILRAIDESARLVSGVGLPRVTPLRQLTWTTLYKWSREACCLGDGECEELLSHECSDRGGDPQGQGADCIPPGPCDPPTPAGGGGPKAPKSVGPEF